ncbi:MAG: hypothetical protein V4475_14390 [Pseudomonadota bacterium]
MTMLQTTLSVALEVKPQSATTLAALIDDLHDRSTAPLSAKGTSSESFAWVAQGVPSAHFISLNIFPGADYDPLFVLEANFDGPPGVFWGQMEAAAGEELRAMLRCCKRPLDQDAQLYDAVTAPGSRAPVAPYCEARALTPSVFHHGNRGMTRDRILDEYALFRAIRTELATANQDGPSPYRGVTADRVHALLRTALLPAFPWLAAPSPRRIPLTQRIGDIARLVAFAFCVVLALSVPGLIFSSFMPTWRFFILIALLMVVAVVPIVRMRDPLPGTGTGGKTNLITVLIRNLPLIAGFILIYSAVFGPGMAVASHLATGVPWARAGHAGLRILLLGLASVPLSLLVIVGWLRFLEMRDSAHDDPPIDEEVVRQMAQREDWIPQNHMGSVVLIKPGVLRTIIVRAGHLGLGLMLRVTATNGYLGSMRTVHFAHWAFVNNGGRLMFFSNFDQSWESYLDDFIEKAHDGLTLAWGCGTGFPATRFLIQDGASHGRKFKNWARHSMAISRFWYSAYRDLTVDQVERNNRIADGLRRVKLSEKDAAAWINEL